MPFKNEYVPPRDIEGAAEFIRNALAEWKAAAQERPFPHPLDHYSAHEHRLSAFVVDTREKFRTGHNVWDRWTIDHEHEMALQHVSGGREDSPNDDHWIFIDRKGLYRLTTTQTERSSPQRRALNVTYRISLFWNCNGYSVPDVDSLNLFKQALDEYHRYSLFDFNAFSQRNIRLIDDRTGKDL